MFDYFWIDVKLCCEFLVNPLMPGGKKKVTHT